MRWLILILCLAAALILIAASSLMNWVFMVSLGKSAFEQEILGGVSVSVSLFVALLPTLMVWGWRARRFFYVLVGLPVFLGFAAFSLSSAIGFAAKNRGSIGEERRLASQRLLEIERDIGDAQKQKQAAGSTRASGVVAELLHGLEQDRRWQSTRSCTDASIDASRQFCKEYFQLKAEFAHAGDSEQAVQRIGALKVERSRLKDRGAGRQGDNQAAILARLLGHETEKVERGLTLFLAGLVEIGAALGLYFATGLMGVHAARRPRFIRASAESRPHVMRLKALPPPAKQETVARRVTRMRKSQN
jgi:hypothetical protein